jgi:endonuclease YncB( thermonuclease family)
MLLTPPSVYSERTVRVIHGYYREKMLMPSPLFRWEFGNRRRSRSETRSSPVSASSWIALLLTLALALAVGLFLRPEGRVVRGEARVTDGDSLRLGATVIRLKGLDAPELAQTCTRSGQSYPCGRIAREALMQLIAEGPVTCRVVGRDRYRRSLARCSVGGRDIGERLVSAGIAVAYGDYEREEAIARAQSAGLWAGSFDLPSQWRKFH